MRLTSAARPTLAYVAAGLVFATSDTLVKALVSTVAPADVVWGRSLVYVALLVIFAGRTNPRRLLRTHALPRQLLRAGSLFGATLCFFYALSELPLGQVTALASATPLIVVAVAGPLLGERVSPLAVLGAIIGFVGVVILVGGDLSGFSLATLLPLGTAAFFAAFSVLSRSLSGEDQYVTLFYTGAGMLALATGFRAIAPTVEPPTAFMWLAIGAVGVGSLVGHRLIVLAYRDGRASDLAPLGYLWLGVVLRDRLRRLLRAARTDDARRRGGDRCRRRPRLPRVLDRRDGSADGEPGRRRRARRGGGRSRRRRRAR